MRDVLTAADIRSLSDMDEFVRAADLLAAIWDFPPNQSPISGEVLRALAFAGNYVAGAHGAGDDLIGASVGFLGRHEGGDLHLHSHISGVAEAAQGKHVGYALKHHQRQWALDRGIASIEWTFDPLVRRNGYFNLTKLGAAVVGYETDFYGRMRDAVNAGDETDRAVVRWDLAREPASPPTDGEVILHPDDGGEPVVNKSEADVLRAWVPEDIVALRKKDAALGRAWRTALRESYGAAIGDGYVATGMSRDGWYTLLRRDG